MQQRKQKSRKFAFSTYSLNRVEKSSFPLVCRILFCVLLGFFSVTGTLRAQQAPLGAEIGLRLGVAPALTYRFVLAEPHLVELLFARTDQSLLFTTLYQKQQAFGLEGLYHRYGGGFSLGGWNGRLISGLDMQVGIDYYIPVVPLVASIDVRPWIRITGDFGVNGELAASVRYVF